MSGDLDDLVDRLRNADIGVCDEAAAEIEALRVALVSQVQSEGHLHHGERFDEIYDRARQAVGDQA